MIVRVIILNYNNYAGLKKCLRSLERQNLPTSCQLRVLIIDNASVDGSALKIQKDFPDYDYIFNDRNLGFSAGVNQGLKASGPAVDYFLLLNHDAYLAADALAKILAADADLAGPTIVYGHQPDRIWQAGGKYRLWKMGLSMPLKNRPLEARPTSGWQTTGFLSGCALLIKSSVFKRIGSLDENFFFYGEDLDLCLRAQKAGLTIRYVADAQVSHDIHDIKISRTNTFALKHLAAAYFLIIRKHYPGWLAYGLVLWLLIYTPFRLYQLIAGGQKLSNICTWFAGGYLALKKNLS